MNRAWMFILAAAVGAVLFLPSRPALGDCGAGANGRMVHGRSRPASGGG